MILFAIQQKKQTNHSFLYKRLRVRSVCALRSLCVGLCVAKGQDMEVLCSRIDSLLESVSLTLSSPTKPVLPKQEEISEVLSFLSKLDASRCEDSIFVNKLFLALAPLPQCLQDKEWFTSFVSWKCPNCGTTPRFRNTKKKNKRIEN
jgi:hypothetical protein